MAGLKPLGVGFKAPKMGLKVPTAPKAPMAPKQPGLVAKPKIAKPQLLAKRDDRGLQVPKVKPATKNRIGRQKQAQAVISLTGGTLGLTALATRGRSGVLARRAAEIAPASSPQKAELLARANKLKDRSTALTTAGAGIGGVGAYNFASYTNAEGKKDIKKNWSPPMEPFYGEPDSFEIEKGLGTAASNFKIGWANPAGVRGNGFSTRAAKTGQALSRRVHGRDERSGTLRAVQRKPKVKPANDQLSVGPTAPKTKRGRLNRVNQVNDRVIGTPNDFVRGVAEGVRGKPQPAPRRTVGVFDTNNPSGPSYSQIKARHRRVEAAIGGGAAIGAGGFYLGTKYEPRNK